MKSIGGVLVLLVAILALACAYTISEDIKETEPLIHSVRKRDITSITGPVQDFLKKIINSFLMTINNSTGGAFNTLILQVQLICYGIIERVFPAGGEAESAEMLF
ncbi:hypothetical protein Trydic_g2791 [Trypoxylus dichotomus]